MPMAGNLTARKVQTAKPGKDSDGGNLYVVVSPSGSRKWVLRFTWRGLAKEMGLGSVNSVPLSDARERPPRRKQPLGCVDGSKRFWRLRRPRGLGMAKTLPGGAA